MGAKDTSTNEKQKLILSGLLHDILNPIVKIDSGYVDLSTESSLKVLQMF